MNQEIDEVMSCYNEYVECLNNGTLTPEYPWTSRMDALCENSENQNYSPWDL